MLGNEAGVRFGGVTEYGRNYKWLDSMKSAQFSPTGEQLRASAGVLPQQKFVALEPPLQRKRRVTPQKEANGLEPPPPPPAKMPAYYDEFVNRDEDYAKRYELGLERRPAKPTMETEYRRKFDADQLQQQRRQQQQQQQQRQQQQQSMIYRSHLQPPSSVNFLTNSTTEYRREFQYRPPQAPHQRGLQPAAALGLQQQQQQQQPRPVPKVQQDGREYKPQETLNPQRLSFPHGRYTSQQSEYRKQFSKADADWLREVQELRRRAAQYRQRSYGTHFSRQHLGQVFARSAPGDAWDEGGDSLVGDEVSSDVGRSASQCNDGFEEDEFDYDVEEEKENRSVGSLRQPQRRARSVAAPQRHRQRRRQRDDVGVDVAVRARTRSQSPTQQRHHFDRTTPSDGVMLVGAQQQQRQQHQRPRKQQQQQQQRQHRYEAWESREPSEAASEIREVAQLPPAGLPTRDSAPLLDEEASHDTPLATDRQRDFHRVANGSRVSGSRSPPPPAPIDEAQFSDGFYSDTSSLISSTSASLAAETLDRARKRRDQFWLDGN